MNTLSDTAKLILGVFSQYGIREKNSLSIFDLLSKKSQWDQYHQHNFNKAIDQLVDKGLIEWGESYVLILTEEGYKAQLHPNRV